jgi:hypothetical protein
VSGRKEGKTLNQVQHDKQRELLGAEWLIADTIRSFQDDKAGGWALAARLTAVPIRFLPSVERTREGVDWVI